MKLMKKLAVMITLFCSIAGAQIYRPINGWCEVGGQGVYAAKSGGTTPVQQYTQGSYTGCTISVFLHGTATLATLYSNSTGTSQANPFQANVLGFYQAFATSGLYDVQESGTVSPPVSLGTVSLLDISTYSSAGGSNTQVQYNCSGSLCGSANFTWSGTTVGVTGGLTASGMVAATTLTAGSGGVTISGGNLFVVGGGTITGGLTIGVGQLLATPMVSSIGLVTNGGLGDYGNYVQFTPITYPSLTCLDSYGDQVGIPAHAPSGPTFGPNDLLLWNSLSPLPVTTGPGGCPTALPPNLDYGLNTNGYFFARAGFATDIGAFNSFHSLVGGFTGATFESGGFYPPGTVTHCCGTLTDYKYLGGHMAMGHSDGPPAVGTIATVNNPLIGFEGLIQGMFYWDDTLHRPQVYDGTVWGPFGGGSGPTGPQYSIQTNSPIGSFHGDLNFTYVPGVTNFVTLGTGVYQATGTSGGFDATQGTASNTVQAPAGGMTALSFSAVNYVQSGNFATTCASGPPMTGIDTPHAGALSYCVGTGEYVYNGTTWVVLAGSGTVTHTAGALTQNAVALGNGAGDLTVMASLGTTGFVLTSQGAGTPPIWSNVSGTGTVTHTTGALTAALPVFGNGGADIKVGTISGNTTLVMSGGVGSFPTGHVAVFDANGNIIDGGTTPGYWTTSGALLYPNLVTYNVLVGRTTDDGSGSKFEVAGAADVAGVVQSLQAACSPGCGVSSPVAFQTSDGSGHNYFLVNANGDVSLAGELNVNNTNSANGVNQYGASIQNNSNTHPALIVANAAGFGIQDLTSPFGSKLNFLTLTGSLTTPICTGCGVSNQSISGYGSCSSHTLGVICQNTNTYGIVVSVSAFLPGSGTNLLARCDSSSTPVTTVAGAGGAASLLVSVNFPVPPGYYYQLFNSGGGSINSWTEYK